MHVVVIGATGRLGRAVVDRALAAEHRVTALVRDPAKMPVSHRDLVVREGDVRRPESLEALAGADAVVFAVGVRGRKTTVVHSEGMVNVVKAMSTHGVKRVVAVSRTAVRIPKDAPLIRKIALRFFIHKVQRNPLLDLERMEDELYHSDLDWTVVYASSMHGGPGSGQYRTEAGGPRGRELPVSITDLADYLVNQSADAAPHRGAVTVTGR